MASIVFEVECECEGVVMPAEPDIGIMGRYVEDADLSSVSALVSTYNTTGKRTWISHDILDGLNKEARDIVISNIMRVFSDDIDQAVLSDA